jgi:hypothetical protein
MSGEDQIGVKAAVTKNDAFHLQGPFQPHPLWSQNVRCQKYCPFDECHPQ